MVLSRGIVARSLVPRAVVRAKVLQNIQSAISSRVSTRIGAPREVVRSQILQNIQVTTSRSMRARVFILWKSAGVQSSHLVEAAIFRSQSY